MSSKDDDSKALVNPDKPLVQRDSKGRFVKGYSGNPAGKPKGIKHRATLIREVMDAGMADMLHEQFIEIMEKAIALAKQGNTQMIKMLLVDIAKAMPKENDGDGKGGKTVEINIRSYIMPEEKVIHEHGSIEGEAVHTDE